jgi:hypothetical protein
VATWLEIRKEPKSTLKRHVMSVNGIGKREVFLILQMGLPALMRSSATGGSVGCTFLVE